MDYLAKTLKRDVREVPSEIHSGAIIGVGDRNEIDQPGLYQPGEPEKSYLNQGPYGGEIPLGTPTVLAQLDALDASPDKDTPIDLVVVSAGINDVRITRLLDPLADERFIAELIELHCHDHLAALLDRIRTRCVDRNPDCRVAVLSYFRMITERSTDFPSVYDFVSALLSEPPRSAAEQRRKQITQNIAEAAEQVKPPPSAGSYATYDSLPAIVKRMITAAARFYAASEEAIGRAVDDANRAPFSHAFVHVTPRIAADQAVFVAPPDSSALWEVRFSDRAVFPVDEVFDQRDVICRRLYPSAGDAETLNQCRVASLGHPDLAGAQRGYFEAIVDAIATIAK